MKPLFKYHCQIETQDGEILHTWGIYPITNDTKILDGIYDPMNKNLKLIFDSVKENLEEIPVRKRDGGKYEYQQRRIQSYHRGVINEEDLSTFLEKYVDNNFEFKEKGLIITDEQQ